MIFLNADTCKDSSAKTGVMTSLYLSPIATNGSYSNYIHITETGSCELKTHLQFGKSLQINNVSLRSKCLTLQIKELTFTGLIFKFILFPDIVMVLLGKKVNAFLESSVDIPTALGNFIVLQPRLHKPNIQAALFAEEHGVACFLQSANVSLFDTQIPTDVWISDTDITFSAKAQIFYIDSVELNGKGTTSKRWESQQFQLNVDMSDTLNDAMTQYARQKLNKQAKEAADRVDEANYNTIQAKEKVKDVRNKLAKLDKEVEKVQNILKQKLIQRMRYMKQKKAHEYYLQNYLETYWNATDELTDSIESVCQIKECERSCRAGEKITICFRPSKTIYEFKTCSYYNTTFYKGHKQVSRAVNIHECSRGGNNIGGQVAIWGISTVAATAINPVFGAVVGVVGLLSIRKDHPTCSNRLITDFFWEEREFSKLTTEYRKCKVGKVGNYSRKGCNFTSECAVIVEDSICYMKNYYCYSNRSQLLLKFHQDNKELVSNISRRSYLYQKALKDLADISFDISSLELKNISLLNQVISTSSILQSALQAEMVANGSLMNINNEEKRNLDLRKYIIDNSIEFSIKIIRLFFDTIVETQTPVLVPLHVVYEVPFRQTNHDVTVVIDISASLELIQKTIMDNIIDDIIDDILGVSSGRRRRDNHMIYLSEIFKENCDLQTKLMNYLNQLYEILQEIYESTQETITFLTTAKEEAKNTYENTVNFLADIGTNNSLSSLLQQREYDFYQSQLEAFDVALYRLLDTVVNEWIGKMESLHNGSVAYFDVTCYSFSDCLRITLNSFQLLLSEIPDVKAMSILEQVSNIEQSMLAIASNSSQNYSQIKSVLIETIQIMQMLVNLDYWCSPPPVILEHPEREVYIQSGNSVLLHCRANTSLPFTYIWKKNNETIPFATSEDLLLPNVDISHSGIYQCEVRNAVGSTKSDESLVYIYKTPSFNQQPNSVSTVIHDNQKSYFTCDVSAFPRPFYEWSFRPNITFPWNVIKHENQSLLYIRNVSYEHEGQYQCNSSNSFGSAVSQVVSLTVLPGKQVTLSYKIQCTFETKQNYQNSSENKLSAFLTKLAKLINFELTPVRNVIFSNTLDTIIFELHVTPSHSLLSVDVEDWLNETVKSLSELFSAKKAIEASFNNVSHPFAFKSKPMVYTAVIGSIQVYPLHFNCSVGFRFDLNDLICGELKVCM